MRVVMVFAEKEGAYFVICVYGKVREYYYTLFSRLNKFIIHKKSGRRSIKKLLKKVSPENLQHANCPDSLEYIKYFFKRKTEMNILRIYEKEI